MISEESIERANKKRTGKCLICWKKTRNIATHRFWVHEASKKQKLDRDMKITNPKTRKRISYILRNKRDKCDVCDKITKNSGAHKFIAHNPYMSKVNVLNGKRKKGSHWSLEQRKNQMKAMPLINKKNSITMKWYHYLGAKWGLQNRKIMEKALLSMKKSRNGLRHYEHKHISIGERKACQVIKNNLPRGFSYKERVIMFGREVDFVIYRKGIIRSIIEWHPENKVLDNERFDDYKLKRKNILRNLGVKVPVFVTRYYPQLRDYVLGIETQK